MADKISGAEENTAAEESEVTYFPMTVTYIWTAVFNGWNAEGKLQYYVVTVEGADADAALADANSYVLPKYIRWSLVALIKRLRNTEYAEAAFITKLYESLKEFNG